MGRLVAERKRKALNEALLEYETHLSEALKRPPKIGSNFNVLTKAAGYFTSKLTPKEKAFFLESAEKYRSGLVPLSTPLGILRSWIIRFNEDYLEKQTFFNPFPEMLRIQRREDSEEEKDYWK
jgi:uncharacterized protein YbgA (DUF1722 family)